MSCDAPNDFHRLPVVEREEGVVLLGGQSGLRLEPVREVRRAVRDRPLLDRLRDARRDVDVELLPVPHGVESLAYMSRGSLSRICRTPKVLMPKYSDVRCARAVFVGAEWRDLALGDLLDDRFSGRQRRRGH